MSSSQLAALGVAVAALVSQVGPSDQLTEVEKLKLELLTTRTALAQTTADLRSCYGALGPVGAKLDGEQLSKAQADLVAAIEKAHPGKTLDVKTGQLVNKSKD